MQKTASVFSFLIGSNIFNSLNDIVSGGSRKFKEQVTIFKNGQKNSKCFSAACVDIKPNN